MEVAHTVWHRLRKHWAMPPSIRKHKELRFGLSDPTVAFAFLCPMQAVVVPPTRSENPGPIDMRERVLHVDRTFEFESGPARGTKVRLTVPFRAASGGAAVRGHEAQVCTPDGLIRCVWVKIL